MTTMRAIVLDAPGPPEALQLREVPRPGPRPGWVLLRVEDFGLNRSELHTRLGLADPDGTFPRVLGIEAAGVIEAAPGADLPVGSKAVAMVEFIPTGVRLTAYGGGADNLPSEVLSDIASTLLRGEVDWPVELYAMEDIARAHDDMEHSRVAAKQVVADTGAGVRRVARRASSGVDRTGERP